MNTKLKALLAFTVIFLVGFASGYLFNGIVNVPGEDDVQQGSERWERGERRMQFKNTDRSERRERMQQRIRDRLVERLDLTAEQQKPFFEQMTAYRSNLGNSMRDIRKRERQRIREHYDVFRSDLSTILNKDQLEKLDRQLHPDSVRQFR